MKLTLDFTLAKPTARQVEFAWEIHKHIFDGLTDNDFEKLCKSSVRTSNYLATYTEDYRKWLYKDNSELTMYKYSQILQLFGIALDPGF